MVWSRTLHRIRRICGSGASTGCCIINDMAWRRVRHPEVVHAGQNPQPRYSSLMQRKTVSAWVSNRWVMTPGCVARRYPAQTRLFGKVTNIADYGAFVELVSASKAWCTFPPDDRSNKNAVTSNKIVFWRDEAEVMVLKSMKTSAASAWACWRNNPWQEFAVPSAISVWRSDQVDYRFWYFCGSGCRYRWSAPVRPLERAG